MITIICNIIVMTITVESSAVGGGIEYHQSPIHSESESDPIQNCVICGNQLVESHIYVSCGNVFPNRNVPFPWFQQTLKYLNLTFVY